MNLQSILDYIPSASTDELRNILNAVQNELPKRQGNVNKYVEYIEDFCSDSQLLDMVWEECQSMELPTKRSKTGSMWLSSGKAPYVYTDTNPVHKATDIASFPCINRLLSLVNLSTEVTGPLDSCLVLKYTSKSSSLSIHDDGEDFIDQEKSICSFSLGCERTLEFFDKASKSKSKCTMSYRMKNNSMVVMRPGAQQNLKHAMRAERSSNIDDDQIRYSLSFRAVSKPKQGSAPNNNTSQCQNDVIEPPTEHVTLVAGDSYAARLDAVRLGKKKCKVVNVAQGGAKMDKVQKQLELFAASNPRTCVEKIILSVGTNDLRYCKDVGLLRGPLKQLCTQIKDIFPNAKVFFQSLLPLPIKDSND